jgi:hypothetical protein
MALDPLRFETPEAYSAFDFSPLMKLGQQLQQQRQQQQLADLSRQYGMLDPSTGQPQPLSPNPAASVSSGSLPPTSSAPIARTFLPPPSGTTAPNAGGPTAAFSAPASSADVDKALMATAEAAGMDLPHWKAIASIESSLDPGSNRERGTQYKGLFQIGSRGEGSEWARQGKGDIYDPMDNASAAASLAMENNSRFRALTGRDPTPIETYMMHQQGLGFYTHGTMTNIAGNLPAKDRTPENMSPQGFERYWSNQIERRAKFFQAQQDRQAQANSNGD